MNEHLALLLFASIYFASLQFTPLHSTSLHQPGRSQSPRHTVPSASTCTCTDIELLLSRAFEMEIEPESLLRLRLVPQFRFPWWSGAGAGTKPERVSHVIVLPMVCVSNACNPSWFPVFCEAIYCENVLQYYHISQLQHVSESDLLTTTQRSGLPTNNSPSPRMERRWH
jgi:hypothetical protein